MSYLQESVAQQHYQTNTRLYNRNVPSGPVQAYLDVRAVPTKYSYFPIVDPRKPALVPMQQFPTYHQSTTFLPGNTTSPWSGFATNVNTESELRNQIYALQKCSQSVYVPSSTSDLYQVSVSQQQSNQKNGNQQQTNQQQTHPYLFEQPVLGQGTINQLTTHQLDNQTLFMNPTRSQMRTATNPC